MEESLAVPGGLDHRSRGPIDLADRDPGAHDGSRGRLRLLHDGMHLGQQPIGLPHRKRPGRVAAVPVEHAAEVEHDGIAGLDRPRGRFVMRRGRVGPGGHDREVHAVVSVGEEPLGEVGRDLVLATTREPPANDVAQRRIGCQGRATEGVDLRGVLASPQGADDRSRGRPRRSREARPAAPAGGRPTDDRRRRSGRFATAIRRRSRRDPPHLATRGSRAPRHRLRRRRAAARASGRGGGVPLRARARAASRVPAASARSRSDRRGPGTAGR